MQVLAARHAVVSKYRVLFPHGSRAAARFFGLTCMSLRMEALPTVSSFSPLMAARAEPRTTGISSPGNLSRVVRAHGKGREVGVCTGGQRPHADV